MQFRAQKNITQQDTKEYGTLAFCQATNFRTELHLYHDAVVHLKNFLRTHSNIFLKLNNRRW
jgi:hypothetical protein